MVDWWTECQKEVTSLRGRHCNKNHCDNFQRIYDNEEYCIKKSVGFPISTCECYRKSDGYYLQLSDLSPDKQEFIKKDPLEYLNVMSEECQKLLGGGDWTLKMCYCCCACFAYDTPIAAPSGFKPIQDFKINDQVIVANHLATDSGVKLSWFPKNVLFSAGTGPKSHEPLMIYLHYGNGLQLICSIDQPFLMPDGKLKRADRLVPGKDELVLAAGDTAPIHEIKLGEYEGGVHHIATDLNFEGSVDGHLLNCNGVVTGDYLLQLHQDELCSLGMFVENHEDLPVIGTLEYESRNASLKVGLFSAQTDEAYQKKTPITFRAFINRDEEIPYDAQGFFSRKEELYLDGSAEKRLITEKQGINLFNYYSKLINAFYPDIIFHLEWENTRTNAYSFKRYGQKIIFIPGGLLRLKDLGMEGLTIILGAQVARFLGKEPLNEEGFTCTGASDYYGIGVVLRDALFIYWMDVINEGLDQINSLFKIIDSIAPDEPSMATIDRPTRICRKKAMVAAAYGAQLSECAGGPVKNGLLLEKVMPVRDRAANILSVNFNRNLSPSADKKENYSLEPAAEIYNAEIAANNRRTVKLTVGCQPEADYTLTVMNVTAADGSTLDPMASSYRFRSPANPSA
jgi:hypothetical protein